MIIKSDEHVFQIKYKETYMKDKEKAVGINMSDSKTLHSLQVAKMSSDVSAPRFFLIVLTVSEMRFLNEKNILTVDIYHRRPRSSTRRAPRRARPTTPFPRT